MLIKQINFKLTYKNVSIKFNMHERKISQHFLLNVFRNSFRMSNDKMLVTVCQTHSIHIVIIVNMVMYHIYIVVTVLSVNIGIAENLSRIDRDSANTYKAYVGFHDASK